MLFELLHEGHESATTAVVDVPSSRLSIWTVRPQLAPFSYASVYRAMILAESGLTDGQEQSIDEEISDRFI